MAAVMVHWLARMDAIEHIVLVILAQLLLEFSYFFELRLLKIVVGL